MPPIPVGSHADIFPTILEALGLGAVSRPWLFGRSLLEPAAARCTLSAQCSSVSPHRVLVDDNDRKLVIELEGVGKFGNTLYARRLVATRLLGADFRDLPALETDTVGLKRRFLARLRAVLEEEPLR